jgi:hypothetical protein
MMEINAAMGGSQADKDNSTVPTLTVSTTCLVDSLIVIMVSFQMEVGV